MSIISLYRYSFRDCLVKAKEIVVTLDVELGFETARVSNRDKNSNKMKLFECERTHEPIEDKKKIVEFIVS
jgi:hypothetical protein